VNCTLLPWSTTRPTVCVWLRTPVVCPLGEVLGEVLAEVLGRVLADTLGRLLGEVLGDALGDVSEAHDTVVPLALPVARKPNDVDCPAPSAPL